MKDNFNWQIGEILFGAKDFILLVSDDMILTCPNDNTNLIRHEELNTVTVDSDHLMTVYYRDFDWKDPNEQ